MRLFQDGVKVEILPECARCTLVGKHPFTFDNCPIHKCNQGDECTGDCEYYDELYEEGEKE